MVGKPKGLLEKRWKTSGEKWEAYRVDGYEGYENQGLFQTGR